MANKAFRYEQVVAKIEDTIVSLNLKAGDKVPSVRKVSNDLNFSLTTIFTAYSILEARGLIISRPRSGYYINAATKSSGNATSPDKYIPLPVDVEISTMATTMMKNALEHGVINFSILAPVNEFLPITRLNKAVQASLKELNSNNFQYPLVEGHPRLLKQIARSSFDWNKIISQNEILVTNGAMEAINLCLEAVTQKGDIVAIESPSYQGLMQSLESKGLKALEISIDPLTGLDLEKLEAALTENNVAACVFSPALNNPIGCSMPEKNKIRLVKMLNEKNIPLIEDDTLGELAFLNSRLRPAKAYDDFDNVMYCSSFSKSLAPGFRIGWVIPGKYYAKVAKLKFEANTSTNGLLQDAIGRYLESGHFDTHLKGLRKTLQKQVSKYISAVNGYFPTNVKATLPAGGYSLWVELPKNIDGVDFQRRALKKGIGICPGHIFSTSSSFHNFIRINCCPLFNNKIDNAIKSLGQILFELQ
jgi:DNA-binding transcriptional MocR family regulator